MTASQLPDIWTKAESRYPRHVVRIGKARAILEAHLADPRAKIILARWLGGEIRFVVRSQSNERGAYDVDGQGCTCPDWEKSGHRCKHWIAVSTLRALIGA